jgi:hypothetical protein
VEVVISTLIVGLLLVAALRTVGSAMASRLRNSHEGRGFVLAHDLMSEILGRSYEEPDDNPMFGPEPGEEASGTRAQFDDVDDYHAWEAFPPMDENGNALPGLAGWKRSVTVEWVNPDKLSMVVGIEQGVKRVQVTVAHESLGTTSLTMVVTDSWQEPPYE